MWMLQSLGCSSCLWMQGTFPRCTQCSAPNPVVGFGIHPFWRWVHPVPWGSLLALDPSRGRADLFWQFHGMEGGRKSQFPERVRGAQTCWVQLW